MPGNDLQFRSNIDQATWHVADLVLSFDRDRRVGRVDLIDTPVILFHQNLQVMIWMQWAFRVFYMKE